MARRKTSVTVCSFRCSNVFGLKGVRGHEFFYLRFRFCHNARSCRVMGRLDLPRCRCRCEGTFPKIKSTKPSHCCSKAVVGRVAERHTLRSFLPLAAKPTKVWCSRLTSNRTPRCQWKSGAKLKLDQEARGWKARNQHINMRLRYAFQKGQY